MQSSMVSLVVVYRKVKSTFKVQNGPLLKATLPNHVFSNGLTHGFFPEWNKMKGKNEPFMFYAIWVSRV